MTQLISGLFHVHDVVAGSFSEPLPFNNEALALRMFRAFLEQSSLARPSDFKLYQSGTFDFSLCKFEIFDKLKFIANGDSVLIKES